MQSKKITEWSLFISKTSHSISQQSKSMPQPVTPKMWIWMVLWRPTRPSRTNTQEWCPFHYRGLECKSRTSRNTWSDRQIWPWSTEWSRAKTHRVLPRECTGHSKHTLPTIEEKITHGYHQMVNTEIRWLYSLQLKMEKLYIVSKNKTRIWLWHRSWTPYCQIQS